VLVTTFSVREVVDPYPTPTTRARWSELDLLQGSVARSAFNLRRTSGTGAATWTTYNDEGFVGELWVSGQPATMNIGEAHGAVAVLVHSSGGPATLSLVFWADMFVGGSDRPSIGWNPAGTVVSVAGESWTLEHYVRTPSVTPVTYLAAGNEVKELYSPMTSKGEYNFYGFGWRNVTIASGETLAFYTAFHAVDSPQADPGSENHGLNMSALVNAVIGAAVTVCAIAATAAAAYFCLRRTPSRPDNRAAGATAEEGPTEEVRDLA
jgi:hypothetical protein